MTNLTFTKEERTRLEQIASHIYRNLTTSDYVKDVKYSELIHYTKQQLNKSFTETAQLFATVHLIDILFVQGKKFGTFSPYENRFERYMILLFKKQYPLIENWWESIYVYRNEQEMTKTFLDEIKPLVHSFTHHMIEKCLLKVRFHKWQAWLQNPSFEQYKKIQATFTNEEKLASLNYVLSILRENLLFPPIQQTYLKILTFEERHEEIVNYMLTYERQPLLLNDEKKDCLRKMEERDPQLLLPVYHQFIVRLIERKTRNHYEEAIRYIKKLQKMYQAIDKLDIFQQYLHQLMKKYQSYRALIQELKQFEAHV